MNTEMFLPERIGIISSIERVEGMLENIREYMRTFYDNDKAVEIIFKSVFSELEEARLQALGQYGRWEKVEFLLQKDTKNGD